MFDVVDSNWGRGEDFILVQEEKGIGKWFVSSWCAWVGIFFKLILLETIYWLLIWKGAPLSLNHSHATCKIVKFLTPFLQKSF
jgi:hypothetical protein